MSTVVYYPHFEPPSTWLKEAALCWDHVEIPVPTDAIAHSDQEYWRSESLRETLPDLIKTVEWVYPSLRVEQLFAAWLEANAADLRRTAHHEPLWRLFSMKFRRDSELVQTLSRTGLMAGDRHHVDLVDVPRNVAFRYIALCAAERARESGADLSADSEDYTDPIFYTQGIVKAEVARQVLQTYLPRDIDAIEVERIIEIRERLRLARRDYTDEIAKLTAGFEKHVSSEAELQDLTADIVKLGRERIEETRRVYRDARLDAGMKVLEVCTVPAAIGAWLASVLHMGVVEPATLEAATILIGAKLLTGHQVARYERNAGPWSYVLRVREELSHNL